MAIQYLLLVAAILAVVFFLVRFVIRAYRRFGRTGAWAAILLEAGLAGGLVWLAARYVPAIGETWIGQQLVLAVVGIVLAIVLGGGLVVGLGIGGRRR